MATVRLDRSLDRLAVRRYEVAAHVVELEADTETRRDLLRHASDLGGFRAPESWPEYSQIYLTFLFSK